MVFSLGQRVALAVTLSIPVAACGGSYRALILHEATQPASLLVGEGRDVIVQFRNESGRPDTDVFPEPPLVIIRRASQERCEIDGGAWVRKSLHLTEQENILLVQEFSGSNDAVVFYETATCRESRRIDVSDAKWKIDRNQLLVGRACTGDTLQSCESKKVYKLDDQGLPE